MPEHLKLGSTRGNTAPCRAFPGLRDGKRWSWVGCSRIEVGGFCFRCWGCWGPGALLRWNLPQSPDNSRENLSNQIQRASSVLSQLIYSICLSGLLLNKAISAMQSVNCSGHQSVPFKEPQIPPVWCPRQLNLSSGFCLAQWEVFLCFCRGVGFRGKCPEGSSEK